MQEIHVDSPYRWWRKCRTSSRADDNRFPEMKPITLFTLLVSLLTGISARAQTPTSAKSRICVDVAHQQRFWNDPAGMAGMDANVIERVKYMTGELDKDRDCRGGEPVLPEERGATQGSGRMRCAVHPHSFGEVHAGEVSAIAKYIRWRRFAVPGDGSEHVVNPGADQCERPHPSVRRRVRRRESRFAVGRPHQSRTHY